MIRRPLPFAALALLSGLAAIPLFAHTSGSGDSAPNTSGSSEQKAQRVVVLGMDGMDAEVTGDWMDAGELPNFQRLREGGTFAPLMPANPAQSPVSWATLNTGVNPGKHGIFDFVGIARGSKSSPVTPNIGFQEAKYFTAEELGMSPAGGDSNYAIMGGGLVLGLVLLLGIGRLNKPAGLVIGLAVAGGAVFFGQGGDAVLPEKFKDYESSNHAKNYWESLDENGIEFRGQGTIVAYPTQELKHGKLIAGLGAPDAKGGLNSSAIYTTAKERKGRRKNYDSLPATVIEETEDFNVRVGKNAGTTRVFEFVKEGNVLKSHLYGPANSILKSSLTTERNELQESDSDPERLKQLVALVGDGRRSFGNSDLLDTSVPISATWTKGASVDLTVAEVAQNIALNHWSDFYQVEFPWHPSYSTWALVRFWVEERDGELEIFASPLQIDPQHPTPGSRISWPASFAADIESRIGRFETLGWACQTHAVKDAELSDDAFLADIEFTLGWRTKMLKDAVEQGDWKVLFHFFGTPDRIFHMLMRHMDRLHPQFDEAEANRMVHYFGQDFALKDSGLVIYKEMDKIVGYVLDEVLAEDDVMMIVSDHGFDSFRRQVDLNAWLAQEGFMALANKSALGIPKTAKEMSRSALNFIDWRESQAYSVAIGKIYLNRKGRESKGIVTDEDADAVLQEISDRLYAMTDPDSGEKVVKKVYLRDDLYSGPYVHRSETGGEGAAEITIDFYPGYRASWSVTGGGITLADGENEDGDKIAIPGAFIYDNDYAWSGDHCGVDIMEVQGIFFSNKQLALPSGDEWYDATHLAPTVLDLQGVAIPENYDRAPLQLK